MLIAGFTNVYEDSLYVYFFLDYFAFILYDIYIWTTLYVSLWSIWKDNKVLL